MSRDSIKKQREHAEQIAAFLEHEKAIQIERDKVQVMLADYWEAVVGPMSTEMFNRFGHLQRTKPIPVLLEAMAITGARHGTLGTSYSYSVAVRQQRYFGGVMRNWREHGRFGVWTKE